MTIPIVSDLLNRVLPGEPAEKRDSRTVSAGTANGNGPQGERLLLASAPSTPAPLLLALDAALAGLEQALDAFVWPAVMTPSRFKRLMREYVHEDWPDDWSVVWPTILPRLGAVIAPGRPEDERAEAGAGGRDDGAASSGDEADSRVAEDLRAIFAGSPPAGLAPVLADLAEGAQAVVMAYNRWRLLLVGSADRLSPELAEAWRRPFIARAADLAWLGVEEAGREKVLWARRREFLAGTARRPERAYDLLAGDGGLTPVWREAARWTRGQGLASFIVSSSGPGGGSPGGEAGLLDLSG